MAFVALASAALFLGAGGSISGIWTTSNSQLTARQYFGVLAVRSHLAADRIRDPRTESFTLPGPGLPP